MVQGRALDLGVVVDRDSGEGRDLYRYELGRLEYSLECWRVLGLTCTGFNYRPEYMSIAINGTRATVTVIPRTGLSFSDTQSIDSVGTEVHEITLVRRPTGWQVCEDHYLDGFVQTFPRGTDFVALRESLTSRLLAWESEQAALQSELDEDPRILTYHTMSLEPPSADTTLGPTAVATYRSYNRSSTSGGAIYYANLYALSYNTKFKPYSRDCQNFVSQCVWYGFGGVNTATAIENHDLPMVKPGLNGTEWWADSSTTGGNWTWTWIGDSSLSGFRQMITDNFNGVLTGVQGREGTMSSLLVADYVSNYTWSHVYIVVEIPDLNLNGRVDYNEIYVSAHTSNVKHVRLIDLISDPTQVHYMYIVCFLNP
jgi:hypothetical protein